MPFGKLYEFDLNGRGNWCAYVRLVQQFILLNEIKSELRVATLVTHVGAATYDLMCDLCSPKHPEEKTFEELVTLVRDHLEPKRSEIAERHIFRQRRQADSESVGTFLQALKHLATHCNFGGSLEENLRDQFVSGLRSEEMRSRLFAEPTLSYQKAVELALALEAAERHAGTAAVGSTVLDALGSGDSRHGHSGDGLHRVAAAAAAGYVRGRSPACWRCGKDQHAAKKCRYRFYSCNKCGKKGHLALKCSKSEKTSSYGTSKSQNYIEESDKESDGSDGLYHFSVAAAATVTSRTRRGHAARFHRGRLCAGS